MVNADLRILINQSSRGTDTERHRGSTESHRVSRRKSLAFWEGYADYFLTGFLVYLCIPLKTDI